MSRDGLTDAMVRGLKNAMSDASQGHAPDCEYVLSTDEAAMVFDDIWAEQELESDG